MTTTTFKESEPKTYYRYDELDNHAKGNTFRSWRECSTERQYDHDKAFRQLLNSIEQETGVVIIAKNLKIRKMAYSITYNEKDLQLSAFSGANKACSFLRALKKAEYIKWDDSGAAFINALNESIKNYKRHTTLADHLRAACFAMFDDYQKGLSMMASREAFYEHAAYRLFLKDGTIVS